MEVQKIPIAKAILSKKSNARDITLDFTLCAVECTCHPKLPWEAMIRKIIVPGQSRQKSL
jgi:hypothetical protein